MFESVVTVGDKLHLITRRLFEGDVRRHFVGTVVGNTGQLCELEGYVIVYDESLGEYRRQDGLRRRIFSLAEVGHIVNRVPRDVEIDELEYRMLEDGLVVTDGKDFELNINEFGPRA